MGKEAGTALGTGGSATPYGAIASAGISAGLGIYQAIKGSKEQRDAKKALENYHRQDLNNVYNNMQVSTRGADLQREEQARLASSEVDALQGAGTRGLVAGLGRVEEGNQRVNLGIGANLDEQQKAIDQAIAQDNANIRGMVENRQNQDISALSSQYQAGKQDANMGLGNIVQGVGSLGNNSGDLKGVSQTNKPGYDSKGRFIKPNPVNFDVSAPPSINPYLPPGSLNRPSYMNNIPDARYFN